jgi:DNA-binding MarR family transcriptional regulator
VTDPPISPAEAVDLTRTDEVDRLRVAVLRLARRIRTRSSDTITPSQLFALGTIIRHERLTIGQIAELEHVKPPSASKIVTALEAEGLVERSVSPDDRRCTHIVATPAGHDHLEQVRTAGRGWISEQLGGLAPADIDAIARALPALERLLLVDA